jgi:NADH-quinone oxidoreductase subunit N
MVMPIEIPNLNFVALAPSLIVMGAALLVLLLDLAVTDKRVLGYLGLLAVVAAAVVSIVLAGYAPLAFQDMAVSDGYALFLNLVFLVTAGLSLLIAVDYLGRHDLQHGAYYALLLFSTSGMMLMAAATDLIVIFLGLEIMSVALYILAGFNRRQFASVEAAMKYFVLGAFASAFFLYGAALTYGATGTTNLSEIGEWLSTGGLSPNPDPMALVGLGLLLVGFAFKVAAVPFQWWTPDVYQGAPTSVTAFMSVGAKAAGFAALIRVLHYSFGDPAYTADWASAAAVLAVLTMTFGNLAALVQKDVKRMLGYSSIAHAGYILVGVAAANESGVRAVLFYLLAYAFMTVGAFAVASFIERRGEYSTTLQDYAGLGQREPLLAAAMAIFMLSLTGIPPLAGFWGKLFVFGAAVEAGLTWLAVVGVINSVVAAFYYLGLVVQMYMRAPVKYAPELPGQQGGDKNPGMVNLEGAIATAVLLAALLTVVLGLWPGSVAGLVAQIPFG